MCSDKVPEEFKASVVLYTREMLSSVGARVSVGRFAASKESATPLRATHVRSSSSDNILGSMIVGLESDDDTQ